MREAEGVFVIEGARAAAEALDTGIVPESVYLAPDVRDAAVTELVARAHERGSAVFVLAAGVIERVADTVTPQPVMAVVGNVDVTFDEALARARNAETSVIVVCADVRDPGNAGTILRSAAGAGAAAVIFCDGSVDPYNPKAVRSAAGGHFHVPLVSGGGAVEVLRRLREAGYRVVGTATRGGDDYGSCDLDGRVAFVVGNEAAGLGDELRELVDDTVTVPLAAGVESLNVAVAASILCFEAARQARGRSGRTAGSDPVPPVETARPARARSVAGAL